MPASDNLVEKILERASLVDLISEVSPSVRQSGEGQYMALCPFHKDKKPSLTINVANNLYHCFACGASGNLFGFVTNYYGYTFTEALSWLAHKYGIATDSRPVVADMFDVAKKYYSQFKTHPELLEFIKSRDLPESVIDYWQIGYEPSPSGLWKYLLDNGYKDKLDAYVTAGLLYYNKEKKTYYSAMFKRLVIPMIQPGGKVIGFTGRTVRNQEPKWFNTKFAKNELIFGLDKVVRTKPEYFILVEGQLDVVALHSIGITNAVAVLGTHLKMSQVRVLLGYCDKVKLLLDADDSGKMGQLKLTEQLTQAGLCVKIAELHKGKDPDDYIKHKQTLQKILNGAKSPVQYFLDRIGTTERREWGNRLLYLLAKITDLVYQDALLDEMSSILDVPKFKLKENLEQKTQSIAAMSIEPSSSGFLENILAGILASDQEMLKFAQRWFGRFKPRVPLLKDILHMGTWHDIKIAQEITRQMNAINCDLSGVNTRALLLELKIRYVQGAIKYYKGLLKTKAGALETINTLSKILGQLILAKRSQDTLEVVRLNIKPFEESL